MLKFISNTIPHILISLLSVVIQFSHHNPNKNFVFVFIFHLWYYVCFSHIPVFKVRRSFAIKLLHALLFMPFWFIGQQYCNAIIYHVSYFIMYTLFLHLQYNQYKKSMPDILCISDNFLRNWPDIIGYRVIGELKLESNDLNNAKKAIKQTNPNAILWASKFGKEFKSILQFCLENEICMNILKGDEIQMPSIANCLEEKEGTIQIYDEKIILFGSNLTFLKKLFDSLSYKNEVYVFLNKKPSILNKLYFRKLFNKQIIYKYNIEKYLKENQYYLINIDGLISFTSKDKDINFLHQVEYLSKICQVHKSNFLLLMTQIYTNIPESSKQMIIAAENITQNYKGETLRLPYIAIDTRYDLYSSKFKKKLINNANISDYGSWISMDSAINKIAENLKQSQDIHIHGSFLSRNEIYHALNMIQRSWNIWPKKLDYIRGHKTCNHPISQNS